MAKISKMQRGKKDQYTVVLEDLRSQFQVFGEGLSLINNKVDKLSKDVTILKQDMVAVKGELAIIRHNQVTRDEFKLLENRVLALEKKSR